MQKNQSRLRETPQSHIYTHRSPATRVIRARRTRKLSPGVPVRHRDTNASELVFHRTILYLTSDSLAWLVKTLLLPRSFLREGCVRVAPFPPRNITRETFSPSQKPPLSCDFYCSRDHRASTDKYSWNVRLVIATFTSNFRKIAGRCRSYLIFTISLLIRFEFLFFMSFYISNIVSFNLHARK